MKTKQKFCYINLQLYEQLALSQSFHFIYD